MAKEDIVTLESGEKVVIPVRFVASAGTNNDWAMYMGWSSWTDQEIASGGDKIGKDEATAIIRATASLDDRLDQFLQRHYRGA